MCGRYSGENLAQMRSVVKAVPASGAADEETVNHVSRFYFNAQQAASETFKTDVVEGLSQTFGVPRDDLFVNLASSDLEALNLLPKLNAAHIIHEKLETAAKGPRRVFLGMLGAHLSAGNIAATSGMIMRWSELDPQISEDGKMTYGRSQVLTSLLRSSRASALANLAACHTRGIPCPAAIASFQAAEMLRDDADEDRVNVLVSYWDASLQAQALRMIFAGQTRPE